MGRHPPLLRGIIDTIFDGVDCDRLVPNPQARFALPDGRTLAPGDEVLTFVNRNLEPYRGYHIFMRALPAVLAARPKAQVVIVGGDDVSYGAAPKDGQSWKEVFLAEVRDRLDMARVHFVGKLPYDRFVDLIEDGVDIAIRIGAVEQAGLIVRNIGHMRRIVVAHRDYWQRTAVPSHPTDLSARETRSMPKQSGPRRSTRTREKRGVWKKNVAAMTRSPACTTARPSEKARSIPSLKERRR